MDVRVGVEVDVPEPFVPWKVRRFDAADGGAPVAVIALGQQQFGQEALVGELFLPGDGQGYVQDCPSAAVIPAWMSPASVERWSSRTSMSSRVPSASPLTRREAAQNASCALVNAPDGLPCPDQGCGAGQRPGLVLRTSR